MRKELKSFANKLHAVWQKQKVQIVGSASDLIQGNSKAFVQVEEEMPKYDDPGSPVVDVNFNFEVNHCVNSCEQFQIDKLTSVELFMTVYVYLLALLF